MNICIMRWDFWSKNSNQFRIRKKLNYKIKYLITIFNFFNLRLDSQNMYFSISKFIIMFYGTQKDFFWMVTEIWTMKIMEKKSMNLKFSVYLKFPFFKYLLYQAKPLKNMFENLTNQTCKIRSEIWNEEKNQLHTFSKILLDFEIILTEEIGNFHKSFTTSKSENWRKFSQM